MSITTSAPARSAGLRSLLTRNGGHKQGHTTLVDRVALTVAALMVLLALVGPYLAPMDPYAVNLADSLVPPGTEYWMGTDANGRDILSRILAGGRTTLLATVAVIAVATVIGTLIGTVAALGSRIVNEVLMRICDVGLSLPAIVVALGLLRTWWVLGVAGAGRGHGAKPPVRRGRLGGHLVAGLRPAGANAGP